MIYYMEFDKFFLVELHEFEDKQLKAQKNTI